MTTYRRFHAVWTLPLLAVIAIACHMVQISVGGWLTPLALCTVVVVFTFPWDNWAVRRGVWDFPDDRLIARISALPVEEIFFFVVQTLHVGWLTALMLRLMPGPVAGTVSFELPTLISIGAVLLCWAVTGLLTRARRSARPHVTYAWHLFYWFAPIIIVQWTFGWDLLAPRFVVIALATAFVGTFLIFSDIWAVRRGIWFFDERQITGGRIATILPWEEAAFFYVTSLLVAQSTILLLPANAR